MTGIEDWRLQYDASGGHPGADLLFGSYRSGLGFTKMPVVDGAALRTDDTDAPRGDLTLFGQDFRGGRTIAFEIEAMADGDTMEEREAAVTALVDEMMAVWDGDAVAKVGGAVAALTAHTGRTAYGRPRSPTSDDTRTFQGRATVAAEFQTLNNLWYDAEQVQTVELVPARSGGMTVPVRTPLVLHASTAERARLVRVGGRAPTAGVFTIYGPIINPVVELTGLMQYGFRTTLAADEWIVVDLRPWRRRILRNGVQNITTTAQSSRIVGATVPPGQHELVLRGTATTGLPRATFAWRDAHKHW